MAADMHLFITISNPLCTLTVRSLEKSVLLCLVLICFNHLVKLQFSAWWSFCFQKHQKILLLNVDVSIMGVLVPYSCCNKVNTHRGAENSRNLFSHGSEVRSLRSRFWQDWFLLEVLRENLFPASTRFWWLLAILGISQSASVQRQCVSPSSEVVSLSVCL